MISPPSAGSTPSCSVPPRLPRPPPADSVQRRGWESGIRISATGTGAALACLAILPGDWWASWWPVALVFVSSRRHGGDLTGRVEPGPGHVRAARDARAGIRPEAHRGAGCRDARRTGRPHHRPDRRVAVGLRGSSRPRLRHRPRRYLPAPGRSFPCRPRRTPHRKPTTPLITLAALAVAAALAHTGLDAMTVLIVPFAVSQGVAQGAAGLLLTLGSLAGLIGAARLRLSGRSPPAHRSRVDGRPPVPGGGRVPRHGRRGKRPAGRRRAGGVRRGMGMGRIAHVRGRPRQPGSAGNRDRHRQYGQVRRRCHRPASSPAYWPNVSHSRSRGGWAAADCCWLPSSSPRFGSRRPVRPMAILPPERST